MRYAIAALYIVFCASTANAASAINDGTWGKDVPCTQLTKLPNGAWHFTSPYTFTTPQGGKVNVNTTTTFGAGVTEAIEWEKRCGAK